jgi:hypothetical protein
MKLLFRAKATRIQVVSIKPLSLVTRISSARQNPAFLFGDMVRKCFNVLLQSTFRASGPSNYLGLKRCRPVLLRLTLRA